MRSSDLPKGGNPEGQQHVGKGANWEAVYQAANLEAGEAVRKLLYMANVIIIKKWTRHISNWPKILNQLAIRFEDRFPL